MSKQYPGGIVSKTPVTPTSLSAPGIWTMNQQAAAQATNTWPFPRDPQFNYVTMLLHGDGSAGPVAATGVGAGVSSTVTNFNADASTNNFNVTINGDARSDNFNPYLGNGYYSNYFDGTGDYLQTPSNAAFNFLATDCTLEFWYFGAGTSGLVFEFGSSTPDTAAMQCEFSSGTLTFKPIGASSTFFAIQPNTWNYIAAVKTGTTYYLYINGTRNTSSTGTAASTGQIINIGARNGGSTAPITGYLSNFRVSNTARYTGTTMTVPTAPTSSDANTVLLTCQSNRFIDTSSNAFTITRNGDTLISPAIPFTLPTTVATYGSGYFDGTGDYLTQLTATTALNLSSGDWSISFWVYKTATANGSIVNLYNSAGNTSGLSIWIGSGGVKVDNGVSGGVQAGTVVVNAWSYIEVIRSSGTTTIYVNGVSAGTTTQTPNASQYGSFGSAADGTLPHQGYIADLRIVKGTALSSSVPTSPVTAVTNTSLLTTQYNGGGNNSGFKDSSQFNFPITRNGNTTQGTFTPYGANWSNYFDGDGDGITSAVSAGFAFGTGDFTYEAWYYSLDTGASQRGMFDTRISSSSTAGVLMREDSSGFLVYINGATLFTATGRVANTWQHIALVRNSGTIRLYVNGVQANSASSSQNFTDPNCRISGFIDTQATPYGYFGYISNARVVKGTCLYPSGTTFTPSITPLTAISGTSLLTCQGNRFFDASSNALTITVNGNTTVQRFSPFAPLTVYNPTTYGGSGYFDGTGDYLSIPSNAGFQFGSSNFTIECWAYMTGAAQQFLFAQWNSPNRSWGILVRNSGTTLSFVYSTTGSNETSIDGTIVAQAGRWAHFAAVRNGNTLTTYMNGVSVASASMSGITLYSASQAIEVGRNPEATTTWNFNGYMTDTRVVNGTAVYTAAFTPPTAPLTAIASTSLLLNLTNAAILDNSMMNNLETVGNAAVSTSVKKYGAASMYFDGSGDGLNGGVISPLFDFGSGSFTVEFWANCVSTSGSGFFVSCWEDSGGSDANASWLVRLNSGTVITHFMQGSSTYNTLTSTTLSANTWFHFAWVKNGTTQTMYINGTSVASGTVTGSMNTVIRSFKVGYQGVATNYLNGYMDDVRITKGYARYTANFTVPDQAFPNG